MRWLARPERRELFLIFFSVTVYFLAYNFESSLSFVGIDPTAAQGTLLRHLGLGKTRIIGADGRRPRGWRDGLESRIYGEWEWEAGEAAGSVAERSQGKGSGRHGAQWVRRDRLGVVDKRTTNSSVNEALLKWGDQVPSTKVVKHVPGYTILDNVFIFNGTMYLVSDPQTPLPPIKSIVESTGPGFGEWKVLTNAQARILGTHGGLIRGASWMSADPTPYNGTLFDLWRLYSTLDPSIDSHGRTSLAPPQRLLFPHNRAFTDDSPPPEQHWVRRARFEPGFHPYLLKAAFPHTTAMYLEDVEDYHKMRVPFVFERLVVADRKAAAASLHADQPPNSPVFELETANPWWEPVRRTLALYFDRLVESEGGFLRRGEKKLITLIDNTKEGGQRGDAVLAADDYERLVSSMRRLARENGYEFQVVSTDSAWDERMDTIVRSTIILGVHGDHLLDSVWMRPSSKATLVELFPREEFVRNRQLVASSINVNYVAWWFDQPLLKDLPTPTAESNQPVTVNDDALAKYLHGVLSKDD